MPRFCHSHTALLDAPQFQGRSEICCRHCTDEAGRLRPRAEVQRQIAGWLASWQPGVDGAGAARRAALFMQAMPAWAGK